MNDQFPCDGLDSKGDLINSKAPRCTCEPVRDPASLGAFAGPLVHAPWCGAQEREMRFASEPYGMTVPYGAKWINECIRMAGMTALPNGETPHTKAAYTELHALLHVIYTLKEEVKRQSKAADDAVNSEMAQRARPLNAERDRDALSREATSMRPVFAAAIMFEESSDDEGSNRLIDAVLAMKRGAQ